MPSPVSPKKRTVPRTHVVGLDMSLSATGYCVLQLANTFPGEHWLSCHHRLDSGVIKPVDETGPGRLEQIRDRLKLFLMFAKPKLAAIEGYAHGASFQAHALGEVGGVARLLLWEMGIPYVEVQPTSLKLFATGKGKCAKKSVTNALNKKWRTAIKDHNEGDAFGLALLAGLSVAPEPSRMSAGEFSIVQGLRFCSSGGVPPAPLLSRSI